MDAFYAAFEDIKGRIMDILWTGGINQRKYSKVTIILQETSLIFREFFYKSTKRIIVIAYI